MDDDTPRSFDPVNPAAPAITPPAHTVERLKQDEGGSVWLVRPPGGNPQVVKTWPATFTAVCKLLVGMAQPQRAARGSRRLGRARVLSPGVGRWRLHHRGGRWLIDQAMDYVTGRSALELALDPEVDAGQQRRIAMAIGDTVRRLAAAGLVHRDLKLDNLIIAENREAGLTVYVLDTADVRRCGRPQDAVARMLNRLSCLQGFRGLNLRRPATLITVRAACRALSPDQKRDVVALLRLARKA